MAKKYHRFVYTALKFCEKFKLVAPRDKIIISLSSGVDSCALTHCLATLSKELNLSLVVAHFNHKMRPNSDADEEFSRLLARQLGFDFFNFSALNKFSKTANFQLQARNWRQQELLKLLDKLNFNKIALGHQRDDLAETLLWKIMRGSSILNLAALKPQTQVFIRPLLNQPKTALIDYMQSLQLNWREDETNFDVDYTRNLLRNDILPKLAKLSDINQKLAHLAQDGYELDDIFNHYTKQINLSKPILETASILSLPALFAKELISRFLKTHHQIDYNRLQIEKIYTLVKKRVSGKQLVFNKVKILVDKNQLSIIKV